MTDTRVSIELEAFATGDAIDALKRTLLLVTDLRARGLVVDLRGYLTVNVHAEADPDEELDT